MTERKAISLKTKLAAALLALGHIPYVRAKTMTAEQIIGEYDFHHNIPHAEGGADEPWNLEPMMKGQHRERTAALDVPQIAKGKRVREKWAKHRAAMAAKGGPPK